MFWLRLPVNQRASRQVFWAQMKARSRERAIQLAREREQSEWVAERASVAREAEMTAQTDRLRAEQDARRLDGWLALQERESVRRIKRLELVAKAADGDLEAFKRLLANKGISAARVFGELFGEDTEARADAAEARIETVATTDTRAAATTTTGTPSAANEKTQDKARRLFFAITTRMAREMSER